LAEVDHRRGPELLGELQTFVHAVDGDDLARAHLPGDRAGVDAEPARPLHHDGLAGAEARDLESCVDLRVGAVDAGRHLVADLRPQLEHGVVGPKVEVLAEAALEMWPDLAGHEPVRLPHGTRLVLAAQARLAAAAREEVAVEHTVADGERLAGRIAGDTRPELGDGPDVLVARVEWQRAAHLL